MQKKKIIIITAIAIAVIVAAYFIFKPGNNGQQLMFTSHVPERGNLSNVIISTGTVQPVNTVSVGCQVSGTIKKLYVDYNSIVKKGQLLAELDRTLFEAALNQAKSNYAQVESQLKYQEGNFSRQSKLYEVGAISKAEYDNATYAYQSAKAQTNSADAQVQSALQNLSFTKIFSPIDGTVLSRSVSEGQTVAASFSTPTIFSIANDLTQMQVEASVDEADIGNINEGDKVVFSVDAYINEKFEGAVRQIRLNPTTTNNVVTYTTIINSPNAGLKLKPGMTANITIFTKEIQNALLVPVEAIKFTPDSTLQLEYQLIFSDQKLAENESFVWLKNGQIILQKKIKTGMDNNQKVEVLEGLSQNDEVITQANHLSNSQLQQQTQQSSPFMPKRPGSDKKKRQ